MLLIIFSHTHTHTHTQTQHITAPTHDITTQRGPAVLTDAFNALTHTHMRERVRVHFVDVNGLEEAGVDGGGLFKEFIGEVCVCVYVCVYVCVCV